MAVYTQIPFEGVIHFDDVVATLAANGGTGMTSADGASLFTKEANIRWDAKYKPVVLAEYFPDRSGAWYKGADGWCGMNAEGGRHAGTAETVTALEEVIDGAMNGWQYVLPTGGAAAPYRIEDFEGYYPQAKMTPTYSIQEKAGNSMGSTLTVAIPLTIDNNTTLAWSDFDTLKNYYFGAIMMKGTNMVARTSDKPLSESTEVSIETENLAAGTWHVFPFFSQNTILSDADHDKTGIFYTIPNTSAADVVISNTDPIILITAQKESPFTVNVTLKVSNPHQGTLTFSTNTVMLKYASSDVDDVLKAGEMSTPLDPFTVATGGTYEKEVSFTLVKADVYNNCRVWVTLNAGAITQGIYPAEEITV